MALIHCPECDREISDRAHSCPHCGYPIIDIQPTAHDPNGYAVVLMDCPPDTSAAVHSVLFEQLPPSLFEHLSNSPVVKSQEVSNKIEELIEHTPSLAARGLPYDQADKLCRALNQAGAKCKIVADIQADHPETLAEAASAQPPTASTPEPLSFGSVVAAVVVGLLIVVLILSFL